jgi:hypothetical protein
MRPHWLLRGRWSSVVGRRSSVVGRWSLIGRAHAHAHHSASASGASVLRSSRVRAVAVRLVLCAVRGDSQGVGAAPACGARGRPCAVPSPAATSLRVWGGDLVPASARRSTTFAHVADKRGHRCLPLRRSARCIGGELCIVHCTLCIAHLIGNGRARSRDASGDPSEPLGTPRVASTNPPIHHPHTKGFSSAGLLPLAANPSSACDSSPKDSR